MPAAIVRDANWLRRGCDAQPNGCWLWRGAKPGKYGHTTVRGKTIDAHRLSYTIMVGPIPNGLMVLHTCDVPACVNPAHLFLGTGSDNMKDAVQKGRLKPPRERIIGEGNGRAKLTYADAETIRANDGNVSRREQARRYKVSPTIIRRIVRGELWKLPGSGAARAE